MILKSGSSFDLWSFLLPWGVPVFWCGSRQMFCGISEGFGCALLLFLPVLGMRLGESLPVVLACSHPTLVTTLLGFPESTAVKGTAVLNAAWLCLLPLSTLPNSLLERPFWTCSCENPTKQASPLEQQQSIRSEAPLPRIVGTVPVGCTGPCCGATIVPSFRGTDDVYSEKCVLKPGLSVPQNCALP